MSHSYFLSEGHTFMSRNILVPEMTPIVFAFIDARANRSSVVVDRGSGQFRSGSLFTDPNLNRVRIFHERPNLDPN
jgi:hypothetical protein